MRIHWLNVNILVLRDSTSSKPNSEKIVNYDKEVATLVDDVIVDQKDIYELNFEMEDLIIYR